MAWLEFKYFHTLGDDYERLAQRPYTGLDTESGVKIFEGDILRVRNLDSSVEVLRTFDEFLFIDLTGLGMEYDLYHLPSLNNAHWKGICPDHDGIEFDVVGNIYENPELLAGQNDANG